MKQLIKDFIYEEDGMGTIEVVIIVGVLVAVALIFKDSILAYVKELIQKYFSTNEIDQSGGDARGG